MHRVVCTNLVECDVSAVSCPQPFAHVERLQRIRRVKDVAEFAEHNVRERIVLAIPVASSFDWPQLSPQLT